MRGRVRAPRGSPPADRTRLFTLVFVCLRQHQVPSPQGAAGEGGTAGGQPTGSDESADIRGQEPRAGPWHGPSAVTVTLGPVWLPGCGTLSLLCAQMVEHIEPASPLGSEALRELKETRVFAPTAFEIVSAWCQHPLKQLLVPGLSLS